MLKVTEVEADERLLVEHAQREPARFAVLYESNFDRVYAYVARRVAVREEAEDITAEVFHQALANLGKFEWRGTPFVAWLFGIAANVVASRYRSDRGRLEAADALDEIAVNDQVERRAMLARLVETLPADQRTVVIGRFVQERSIAEIATMMGRSEGAVKQLQFRALQTLRARVKGSV